MASNKRGIGLAKIMFVISVVLISSAVVLMFQYLSTADERALEKFDTAQVLVASEAISRGTSLEDAQKNALVELRTYPVSAIPTTSLQEISPSNNYLVALADIAPGQILVNEIFGERTKPAIDFNLPAGKVAVTVELSYAARVAAFIKPGVNVAVFSTTQEQNNRASKTSVLFTSLQVLAVGQQVDPNQSASVEEVANFITLAVDYDQASRLVQSLQSAKLYLALLNDSSLVGSQSKES